MSESVLRANLKHIPQSSLNLNPGIHVSIICFQYWNYRVR